MTRVRFKLAATPDAAPGYRQGMRHPCLAALLQSDLEPAPHDWLEPLEQALQAALPDAKGMAAVPPKAASNAEVVGNGVAHPTNTELAWRILHWTHRVQVAADWPIFEQGKVFAERGKPQHAALFIATVEGGQAGTERALDWVIEAFNAGGHAARIERSIARLPRLLESLTKMLHFPSNTPRLVRAAYEQGIPAAVLEGTVYRLGQGRWGRWINSSLTDETPQIGAAIARDKMRCATVIRRAGMPAPEHQRAGNADDAVAIARRLGYPVVIKPADLDGGAGVASGLIDEKEVRQAFEAAHKVSKAILVEKHFEGRDYRITVFGGAMIWAVERVPGGVTGDGRRTVRELAERLNADPRRQEGVANPRLRPLKFDAEADLMVARAGLTPDSVPAEGQFVRFRRASNVTLGGTPVSIMHEVHPDNAALAVRAAAALKLDIAGVDLLIPHIAQSWLETGALICEVNSGPTLGQTITLHLYPPLVKALVDGTGRMRVAVVVGAKDPQRMGLALVRKLAARGLVAGWASHDHAVAGTSTLGRGSVGPVRGGRMLMLDSRIGAAILFLNDTRVFRTGLPFERFDVLLILGEIDSNQASAKLVSQLLLACDGGLGARTGVALSTGSFEQVPAKSHVDWLVEKLTAADVRHRGA